MKTVAVFGVTGQQGSWAAKAFKESGWHVIGVSRSGAVSTKPELAVDDIKVVRADLLDPSSVAAAISGCDAVFGVTTPYVGDSLDEAAERSQVRGLLDGCKAAGVKHLIYTGVLSPGRGEVHVSPDDDIPYSRAKFELYRDCLKSGVPLTFLGPTHFFENIGPYITVRKGLITGVVPGDVKVPYVTCRDIGKMAVLAAEMGPPASGKNRYLPVWTDFVSGDELALELARSRGKKEQFVYETVPLESLPIELRMMRQIFERDGRPPACGDPKTVEQMVETRALLKNDVWTLSKFLEQSALCTIDLE